MGKQELKKGKFGKTRTKEGEVWENKNKRRGSLGKQELKKGLTFKLTMLSATVQFQDQRKSSCNNNATILV